MRKILLTSGFLLLSVTNSFGAVIYLRSTDGADADDGLSWANAKLTSTAAIAAAGIGGTVYMSDNHSETPIVSLTLTSPGTAASPLNVLCVDDSAEPPTALATSCSLVLGANNNAFTFSGYAYYYGILFQTGISGAAANINFVLAGHSILEQCKLTVNSSNASGSINLNPASTGEGGLLLINPIIKFSHVSQSMLVNGYKFEWMGGSVDPTGSSPTELFDSAAGTKRPANANLYGVDLSHLNSGESLVTVGSDTFFEINFYKCKLGSSVGVVTGTYLGPDATRVRVVNCDSDDTNYRYHKSGYQGDITQETTIVRVGGATDGTTPVSRKMVTSANSEFLWPLESDAMTFWNEKLEPITITVEVITDNVTLTDAEAWLEVQYQGTSGFPQSVFTSDRVSNILATPANQPLSSAPWNTTGLTTPVKQTLSVTFTPAEKGVISAKVMLAKVSTTMYFDPKIIGISARQYMGADIHINEGTRSVGGFGVGH